MKVVCQICDKIINTEVNKKGDTGYPYSFTYDDEPCINVASMRTRQGYLCNDCSKKIVRIMRF